VENRTQKDVAALLAEATPEAASQLQELAESAPDKETRKVARRALYRLSLAGVRPPERAPAPKTAEPTPSDTLRAYASAYDGAGNRLVFCVVPDPDGGWPTLLQTLINDEEGTKDFSARRMSRREVAERVDRFEQQLENGLAFAEIEGDYGRWLLHEARLLNLRLGQLSPPGFLEWMERVGEPRGSYETPPVFAALNPEEVRADPSVPHDPAAFFALPWFEPWFLAARDVYEWLDAWEKSEASVLAVPESAKAERRERIVTEAVNKLLTPEARERYTHRLEESADILRRRDKMEAARIALYHALALADNKPVADVPFARALVRRTIEAAAQMLERIRHGEAQATA